MLWYAALRNLSRSTASILQLAGPLLAAGGGVLLLGERIATRLLVAGALVLGGIASAIVGQKWQPAVRGKSGPRPDSV